MNMHVRMAGEAEHCRVGNYVTAVNVYKFGWWGSIIENNRLRVIFRGRTHLNFREFQRFSGGIVHRRWEGVGAKMKRGWGGFGCEVRRGRNKRKSWKKEAKDRDWERRRLLRKIACMCHVSLWHTGDNCVHTLNVRTCPWSPVIHAGTSPLCHLSSSHAVTRRSLSGRLLSWRQKSPSGQRSQLRPLNLSAQHSHNQLQSGFSHSSEAFFVPWVTNNTECDLSGVVVIFQPLPATAQLSRGDRRISVSISLISHEILNVTQKSTASPHWQRATLYQCSITIPLGCCILW